MAYKENRIAGPVHPTTRITSSTTSETATVKPWIYMTPALHKPAHEKRAYLASEKSPIKTQYTLHRTMAQKPLVMDPHPGLR
jgi:hypothetical protein